MRFRLKAASAFIAAGAFAYLSYNVVGLLLDPYNVFWNREDMDRGAFVSEQFRYHKTEELLREPSRYDTIILGNSRAFDNRNSMLQKTTALSIFNYSSSSDYPLGYLLKIQWLTRTQINLKNIVMELWYDQFQMAGTNDGVLLAREHPSVSGESWIRYYWAFSELPFETARNVMLHRIKVLLGLPHDTRVIKHNGYEPGSGDYIYYNPTADEEDRARKSYQQQLANDNSGNIHFRNSFLTPAEQDFRARALSGLPLQEIQSASLIESISILKSSKIQYQCVVPPMNAKVVSWVPREKYIAWMQFVLGVCGDLWDFSLPSAVTADNFNYVDWSHFVHDVSFLALAKVLGGSAQELKHHPEFGQRLSRRDSDRYASLLDTAMSAQQLQ